MALTAGRVAARALQDVAAAAQNGLRQNVSQQSAHTIACANCGQSIAARTSGLGEGSQRNVSALDSS